MRALRAGSGVRRAGAAVVVLAAALSVADGAWAGIHVGAFHSARPHHHHHRHDVPAAPPEAAPPAPAPLPSALQPAPGA